MDVTYYNTLNKGQIFDSDLRLSYATGFVLNTVNVSTTRNQGVEIVFNAAILKRERIKWDMTMNFNHMWNMVLEMPAEIPEYYIAATNVFQNIRSGVKKGYPTTIITGYGYLRNTAGDIIISPTSGLPVLESLFKPRGDRNPTFTMGWNNVVRYRNWRLSMLWDLRVGGDIFNGTEMFLTNYGRSMRTADRFVPRVVKGVLQDGKENTALPTRNTIVVIPAYTTDAAFYTYTNMPEEAYVEKDINVFRMRDITLSYTFGKIRGFKGLSLFITGNELILMTNYTGADPQSNANTAGTKGIGTFGFDFGKIPTPVSINVGLNASF